MPIPQELFFIVGRASCPSYKFMKRTFARGLLKMSKPHIRRRKIPQLLDKLRRS